MNKKASIQDIIFIGVVLLVISVTTLIAYKINNEINTKLPDVELIASNPQALSAHSSINNMYPGVIDNGFLLLAVGLAIVAFVFAFMVRIHPIFIGLFVLVLVGIIFISGIFSNIYQEIAAVNDLTALADSLRFTSIIMRGLPLIVTIIGGLLSIVMYKTWQEGQLF